MTRDQAIELARAHARTCTERHAYMPTTAAEAATWEPHQWVIEAILTAHGAPIPHQPVVSGDAQ